MAASVSRMWCLVFSTTAAGSVRLGVAAMYAASVVIMSEMGALLLLLVLMASGLRR